MSTEKPTTFDFQIDYSEYQELADEAAAFLNSGEMIPAIITYWGSTDQWCQVTDIFGHAIRGVDWPMEVGEAYELDPVETRYSPLQPYHVRVLREATHEEAEAIARQSLPRRKFYYQVMSD